MKLSKRKTGKKERRARTKLAKSAKKRSPVEGMSSRSRSEGDVPPNENHRKHPDEVYGDTEIPFRPK